MIEFPHRSKNTYFNLLVYKSTNEISERANKWFVDTYIDYKPYIPKEIILRNLLMDLDFLFAEGFWVVEVGESLGLDITDVKETLQRYYERYMSGEHGYQQLVHHRLYDSFNNKLLTEEEADARDERMRKLSIELVEEILREEKNKK
jgi:hypothetical protein